MGRLDRKPGVGFILHDTHVIVAQVIGEHEDDVRAVIPENSDGGDHEQRAYRKGGVEGR